MAEVKGTKFTQNTTVISVPVENGSGPNVQTVQNVFSGEFNRLVKLNKLTQHGHPSSESWRGHEVEVRRPVVSGEGSTGDLTSVESRTVTVASSVMCLTAQKTDIDWSHFLGGMCKNANDKDKNALAALINFVTSNISDPNSAEEFYKKLFPENGVGGIKQNIKMEGKNILINLKGLNDLCGGQLNTKAKKALNSLTAKTTKKGFIAVSKISEPLFKSRNEPGKIE